MLISKNKHYEYIIEVGFKAETKKSEHTASCRFFIRKMNDEYIIYDKTYYGFGTYQPNIVEAFGMENSINRMIDTVVLDKNLMELSGYFNELVILLKDQLNSINITDNYKPILFGFNTLMHCTKEDLKREDVDPCFEQEYDKEFYYNLNAYVTNTKVKEVR